MGVFPRSWGVTEEENRGVQRGEKCDKDGGGLSDEEVGNSVWTRGGVAEVAPFPVHLLEGDWGGEVMVGHVGWYGVRRVEGGWVEGNQ